MILPDPIIFTKPLHVWLGIVILLLLITQILIGLRFLKVPFWIHTKVIWRALLVLALILGYYGFQIYFLQ